MAGEAWYLVPSVPASGSVELDGGEGRHAVTVRRTRIGEQIVVTDGAGSVSRVEVTQVGGGRLTGQVVAHQQVAPPPVQIRVAQAIPKGDRGELAVDLLTEAGVDAIVPWQAARCVARWSGEKSIKGVEKWRTVARETAKQARRPFVPEVTPLHSTAQLLELVAEADRALVLHEAETSRLAEIGLPETGTILLIVGPEGGVDSDELSRLHAAGASSVRLGPEVLRTSTAGAVALGALGVLTRRW